MFNDYILFLIAVMCFTGAYILTACGGGSSTVSNVSPQPAAVRNEPSMPNAITIEQGESKRKGKKD